MFDPPRVLGVDPGLGRVGLALVGRDGRLPSLSWARTIRTPAGVAEPVRLRAIATALRAAIADGRPASVAVERIAWNRNAASAMAVARATGVVLLVAAEAGIPVREYGPLEVKMAVAGAGNADKRQVQSALVRVHGLRGVPAQADAADAVAVALTDLTRSRLGRHAAVAR
jgi:crossover junction endodeoxyribonuclease RuvC